MEWFENEDFWRSFYGYMFSAERFAAVPDEVTRILALTKCSGGNMLDLCWAFLTGLRPYAWSPLHVKLLQ
jgi:hypothetical protein